MLATTTACVYTEEVPCHPGSAWTRFVCISDTHSRKFTIPPGDVLLHAGDLSSYGEFDELKKVIEWLKSLEHPIKMCLHDRPFPLVFLWFPNVLIFSIFQNNCWKPRCRHSEFVIWLD